MHPFIHLGGDLNIPSYMLILSLTYCLGLAYTFWRARRLDKDVQITLDIALAIMGGGFIGARFFHVIYESPAIYRANPWEIFKVWQGGFVYYGGLIGAAYSAWIYTKLRRESFWEWADFFAPVMSIGYAIGRFACLLNGCCYGALCELPWAVEFNHPGLPLGLRHPAPLYASLFELCVFALLIFVERRKIKELLAGDLFLIWIMLHGCGRIVMETFRDDFRGPTLGGFSVSSVISFVLVVGALVVMRLRHRKAQ